MAPIHGPCRSPDAATPFGGAIGGMAGKAGLARYGTDEDHGAATGLGNRPATDLHGQEGVADNHVQLISLADVVQVV